MTIKETAEMLNLATGPGTHQQLQQLCVQWPRRLPPEQEAAELLAVAVRVGFVFSRPSFQPLVPRAGNLR